MELEIQLISEDIIKPLSPTPNHLRDYRLSFLDQTSPPVYNPLVLFYQSNGDSKTNHIEQSNHLKQSLSEVLTHYYPLSGRIKDNLSVNCNDQGVPFLQKQVKCKLSQMLQNPAPTELTKLTPSAVDAMEFPLGIQFNTFLCGGTAIGIGFSHKVGDASSVFSFIKTWAASARGESNISYPEFISATLFPPMNISGFTPFFGNPEKNLVAKRFVFNKSSIESLKERYGKSPSLKNLRPPSRIEVLSAFLGNRFAEITFDQVESGTNKTYSLVHLLNFRPRMEPPLPENSFGNYYTTVHTTALSWSGEGSFDLVGRIRDSISKIDKEFLHKLQKGSENSRSMPEPGTRSGTGERVFLCFTSLCRFPLYDADFGWAKPVWVGAPSLTFRNVVVFTDTASGDGIEAVVHLDGKDMVRFQEDLELLRYVAPPDY